MTELSRPLPEFYTQSVFEPPCRNRTVPLSPSTLPPSRSARPAPGPRPGSRSRRLPWGWIELVTLSLVLIPALTFVPFLAPIRLLLRVAQYGIGMAAWIGVLMSGRAHRLPSFPGRSWATFCVIWLLLQVLNPMGDLPLAAPAHCIMTLSILSPIFWAPRITLSYARVEQMIRVLFVCSCFSLIFGFLQYYNPGHIAGKSYISGRFDPPTIQVVQTYQESGRWKELMIERSDGQKVFRPCGLTDSPGGAAGAASNCCLIGMVWILRRGPSWKRGFYCLVCLMSMVMLYFCQVRVIYLVTLGGLGLLGFCLFLRRDFRSLTILATIGLAIFVAALGWVIRNGGAEVLKRFEALVDKSSTKVYSENRGVFLESVFNELIWDYPLGSGLGHWGTTNLYFGHPRKDIYSEIQFQAWVYDGGIPLMVAYSVAAVLTIWHVFRISIRTRNQEFAKVACTIVGMAMGILVSGLSGMPFISSAGLQFWLILGAVIGASSHEASAARSTARPRLASGRGRA